MPGWRTLCVIIVLAAPVGAYHLPRLPHVPSAAARAAARPRMSEKSSGGLRILEWIPSQQLLVGTARFTWNTLWKVMLSELAPQSSEGDYVRPAPQTGSDATWPADLPATPGRYHIYVGNACPWCHRALIALALHDLQGFVSYTRLADDPERASRGGWCFDATDPDPLLGASDLREVYNACTPGGEYRGRCTAPLLVDLSTSTILSSESADIVRLLGQLAARRGGARVADLLPPPLRGKVEETSAWVYEAVNNGVYRAGFATTQRAYERAEADVHAGLARCVAAVWPPRGRRVAAV